MIKSSKTAVVAAITAVILALYELLAILTTTDSIPTITEFIEARPAAVELVAVGGLMVWLAAHFGWFAKLMSLIEAEEDNVSSMTDQDPGPEDEGWT